MMTLNVNVKAAVEYELDAFRPGCSTEPPDPALCEIYGVWVTLPCGRRLFNLGPFLDAGELDDLKQQIVMEAEEGWVADEADYAADNAREGWEVEVGGGGEVSQ